MIKTKHEHYNAIRRVVLNPNNELKHMKPIRNMVDKFEMDFGVSKLSLSLWTLYNKIYNIITK